MPNDTSAYVNIPIDAVRNNTTPFRVKLASDFTCGRPVALTLDVTTAQGPASVDLSVPTGGPGGPHSASSTDVPKAIPDDGAVESTLALAGGAKIVDVNATVGQITHTFDSDLVISLIGPDATTVVLGEQSRQLG